MGTPQSPSRFSHQFIEDASDPLYPTDAVYMEDISQKMRVPKRIKATGEFSDEDILLSNQNGIMNSWNYSNKIDMNVPDRIVVIGQDQHLGTRSAPREIVLENSILPKDPGFVRVATPPRVITLNQHHFPSASDENNDNDDDDDATIPDKTQYNGIGVVKSTGYPSTIGFNPDDQTTILDANVNDRRLNNTGNSSRKNLNYGDISFRDSTPPLTENMSPAEEVQHLRRQLAKINRRVHCIELENLHRQQREKIIYCLGLAYFLLKTIFWLNRN